MTTHIVSVTRFRARSWRFLLLLMLHAQRSITQARKADGFVAGAVRRDSDLAFWTMTVWRDERAMYGYVASGAHRQAMPRLSDWGEEASAARWMQDGAGLPEWAAAVRRMREEGRPLPLRHPGPNHATLSFAEPQSSSATRF